MWAPQAVRVDSAGKVYVVDSQPGGGGDLGGRILIFNPPLTSGMNANGSLGAASFGIQPGLTSTRVPMGDSGSMIRPTPSFSSTSTG